VHGLAPSPKVPGAARVRTPPIANSRWSYGVLVDRVVPQDGGAACDRHGIFSVLDNP